MKKQYLIYADESHRKGKYFSNFYGGALVSYNELKKINEKLNNKKKGIRSRARSKMDKSYRTILR